VARLEAVESQTAPAFPAFWERESRGVVTGLVRCDEERNEDAAASIDQARDESCPKAWSTTQNLEVLAGGKLVFVPNRTDFDAREK
jgi:hypothetical protein